MSNSPSATPAAASLECLRAQVLDAGLCVACGACVGLCPHLVFYDGQVAAPDACGLGDGRCLDLCPQATQAAFDPKRQDLLAGQGRPWQGPLGPMQEACWARSLETDLAGKAQYGGVVSTLVSLALQEGLIGEAVLTQAGQRGAPEGARARSRAEVLACAGSIYSAGAGLSALNQALAEPEDHPLGVVALPCQSLGAAAMAVHPRYARASRLALVIGLFCTLNLSARGLRQVLAQAGVVDPVLKADFPPPPAGVMEITTHAGTTAIPLDKVYPVMLKGCAQCPDLTAEMADISVGAAEGLPGWNTVIVRSPRGRQLMDLALAKGLLETQLVPAQSWEHLSTAAANKRARAQAAAKERRNG